VAYILSENRTGSSQEFDRALARYREHLHASRTRFPPSAYAIATSDWYYSLSDPRSPHDAWLVESRVIERPRTDVGVETRIVDINVRLLNGSHDRYLDFFYSRVSSYTLEVFDADLGHRDWRYDEFRLSDDDKVIHEIEWYGPRPTGRWIIVASDIELTHTPVL
jgi:hypothetical protein